MTTQPCTEQRRARYASQTLLSLCHNIGLPTQLATTTRVEAVLAPGGGYRVVRYATPPEPVATQRMLPEEARFEVHMP